MVKLAFSTASVIPAISIAAAAVLATSAAVSAAAIATAFTGRKMGGMVVVLNCLKYKPIQVLRASNYLMALLFITFIGQKNGPAITTDHLP
ncbi:hypothetical protein [Psychromonas sp. MB-3u-54]|uniref:hypothetical protein n=1 Tax=Psychromonas sp. MB-3u-54 TaxID=2058319 RepID=UPI0012FE7FD0|nr:hypothetical protein [Psychromonas sp. MB-3u-54]